MTTITGTREWATQTINCLVGCSHDCRYCYARERALRFRQIREAVEWSRPRLRPSYQADLRRIGKSKGQVMFPSTHDILPEFLEPCLDVVRKLLDAGKCVLIVTKPHFESIRAIGEHFAGVGPLFRDWRDRILFRFTIGAMDERLLSYWEPGAPTFQERMYSLALARRFGFETSVSCEPLLESERVVELVRELEPYVTETIWIGKMNRIRRRCIAGTSEEAIRRIEAGQTDQRVREIYELLKDRPKIRWKDSYRSVIDECRIENAES